MISDCWILQENGNRSLVLKLLNKLLVFILTFRVQSVRYESIPCLNGNFYDFSKLKRLGWNSALFSSNFLFSTFGTLTVMFLTPVEIQIAIIKLKYWTLILIFDPEIGPMLTLKCITAHQYNKYLKNRKSEHKNWRI